MSSCQKFPTIEIIWLIEIYFNVKYLRLKCYPYILQINKTSSMTNTGIIHILCITKCFNQCHTEHFSIKFPTLLKS
jgi:hypothetical protein